MVESRLKPANENPWYVLMTLYGEQGSAGIDEALQRKNSEIWNRWFCSALTEKQRTKLQMGGVILPKPLRLQSEINEVKDAHRAEMVKRNGSKYKYQEAFDFGTAVELNGVAFSCSVDLGGFIFTNPVFINNSLFQRNFNGQHAIFCDMSNFSNISVVGNCSFVLSRFFERTIINRSSFKKSVRFFGAQFSGGVDFQFSRFCDREENDEHITAYDADFDSAEFQGRADFGHATFSENARFISVTFHEDVYFWNGKFKGDTYFEAAHFKKSCRFDNAGFGAGDFAGISVDFARARFDGNCSFQGTEFKSQFPNYSGAILHSEAIFDARIEFWPTLKQPNPSQAKQSCARIRSTVSKQGLAEEEHFFFRREMELATQIGGFWQRLPYRLFGRFSDFGYSIAKPTLGFLACSSSSQ